METHLVYDIRPGEVRCPKCYSRDVASSLPHRRLDRLMIHFHRVPRQCRFCGHRFYVRQDRLKRRAKPGNEKPSPGI